MKAADNTEDSNSGKTGPADSNQKPEFRVYKKRWYILAVYCLVGLTQYTVGGTFGPIAQSCETALDLTQTDFALLANWYNVGYLILNFPFIWLVQKKGLRLSMAITVACCAAGASLRCLHTGDRGIDKAFIHFGQLVNSFAAPVPWFACTKISAEWFPPNERNLATSLALSVSGLGSMAYYLIGPMFIDAYKESGLPDEVRNAIYKLFYMEAIVCNVMLVIVILHFPSKPPTPPSVSAAAERCTYSEGFRKFFASRNACIMCAVIALNALCSTWDGFFALIVKGVMEETEVGWVGSVMAAANNVACPIFALILRIPWFGKRAYPISIITVALACLLFAIFPVAATIPSQRHLLSTGLIWGIIPTFEFLITMAQPVWWEMTCDSLYPVPESVVSGMLSYCNCLLSNVFYVVLLFPQLGFMWLNWALLFGELMIVPLLLLYRNEGKRTEADQQQTNSKLPVEVPAL